MKIGNNSSIDIMKQANLQKVQKAAQTALKRQEEFPGEESKRSAKRDEYIPSEKDEPIGLYKMEYDESGSPGIKFDSPESKPADKPDKQDKSEDKPEEPKEPEKEKSESEKCVCDTGKVDRELKKRPSPAEVAALLREYPLWLKGRHWLISHAENPRHALELAIRALHFDTSPQIYNLFL